MKIKKKKYLTLLINTAIIMLVCLMYDTVNGQEKPQKPVINDSIVKAEMAFFVVQKSGYKKNHEAKTLKKIELRYSDDTVIYLSKGGHRYINIALEEFDASKHTILYNEQDSSVKLIDGKPAWGVSATLPTRKVKGISYIHVKARKVLPDSAFHGIFAPPVLKYKEVKFQKKIEQPYFKSFISSDGWRMYIYMLNGTGKDRYEVTWVVNGFDYYGRFINHVPE